MSGKNKQKTPKILILLLTLTLLLTISGCRTASDLVDPDSYSSDNSEPWEKNVKEKKNNKTADEL